MNAILRQWDVLFAQAGKLLALFVLVLVLVGCTQTTPTHNSNQQLDTPSLIQLAYDRGEITKDERLLYLAYALYEPESLPVRYRSRIGWFGDVEVRELDEVIKDPLVVCSMSRNIRTEFQRLLRSDMTCERNAWFPVLAGILVLGIMTFVLYMRKQQSQKLFT